MTTSELTEAKCSHGWTATAGKRGDYCRVCRRTAPAEPPEAFRSYLEGLEDQPADRGTAPPTIPPSNAAALTLHPITAHFPEMRAEDYDPFKQDIQTNGQLVPIVAINGQVVDGRHRLRACLELGIEPKVLDIAGDPIALARSLNLRRRHMTADQIAATFIELTQSDPATSAEVEKIRTDAKARQRAAGTQSGARRLQSRDRKRQTIIDGLVIVEVDPPEEKKPRAPTATGAIAKTLKVSESTLRRTEKVAKLAPQKLKEIVAGSTTSTKILRERAAKTKGAPPPPVPDGRLVITTLESLSSAPFAKAIKAIRSSATAGTRAKVGRALDDARKALDAYTTSVRGAK